MNTIHPTGVASGMTHNDAMRELMEQAAAGGQNSISGMQNALPLQMPEAQDIALANDTEYGLNAYVQTNDLTRAHRVARRLAAGSVWINRNSDLSPQSPYGGYKQSGNGRAGGLEGLHEFQQVKNIRVAMP